MANKLHHWNSEKVQTTNHLAWGKTMAGVC